MAQIVYYVWAQLRVSPDGAPVSFCVPTGNFGNVLAGWAAKQMGLPVDRLIVASNRNDILARAISHGDMSMREVIPTTSPSMDIQVSSNFERLLFELVGRDGRATSDLLGQFRSDGRLALSPDVLAALQADFGAGCLDDTKVSAVIDSVHEEYDVLVDPHTAVGLGVAQAMLAEGGPDQAFADEGAEPGSTSPIVCLATAHPAKFPDAVFDATGVRPVLPDRLAGILDRPERVEHVEDDLAAVEDLVRRVLAVRP